MAFSRSGTFLATARNGMGLRLSKVHPVPHEVWMDPEKGKETSVHAVLFSPAFSPEGELLAASSCTRGECHIQFWWVTQGMEVKELEDRRIDLEDAATCLAFSPDGEWLASGAHSGAIHLWDMVGGKGDRILEGHEGHITSLSFSSDGRELFSGSWDSTVLVWDLSLARSWERPRLPPKAPAAPKDRKSARKHAPRKHEAQPLEARPAPGMHERIQSLKVKEPDRLQEDLMFGLGLLQVSDEERGVPERVLKRLDDFLRGNRASRRHPAHSLAVILAAVLGHQLKKDGWRWVSVEWNGEPALPRLEGSDSSRESAEHWGLTPKNKAFLVLPIHELLAAQLDQRIPIGFAERVTTLLERKGTPKALELVRLIDEPQR
jgi:hypothetical protein